MYHCGDKLPRFAIFNRNSLLVRPKGTSHMSANFTLHTRPPVHLVHAL